jgi:hypothetical protein
MNCTILGNRIPYEYFITTGKGESNAGSEGLPYETAHMMLEFKTPILSNIRAFSSILFYCRH